MAEEIKAKLDSEKLDELLKISKEIKYYMRWQNILAIIRLLVIVIPITLGFIYLPPLLKTYIQNYQSLIER